MPKRPIIPNNGLLPPQRFPCIVADPPWPYNTRGPMRGNEGRSGDPEVGPDSNDRYGFLSIAELCEMNVVDKVEDNAHLYLWATNSFIVEAHIVARSWGFEPKTLVTWLKVKLDGTPSMKTGFYYRGATEHCLFCVRGKLRLNGPCHPTVFETLRLPHSTKPEYFYNMVEEQSYGPYLELFARRKRKGWFVWGDEVESDIFLDAPVSGRSHRLEAREALLSKRIEVLANGSPTSRKVF